MGPRIAGFLTGTVLASFLGAYFISEKVNQKNMLTDIRLMEYEREIEKLQQRMEAVRKNFVLLKQVQ